MSIKINLKIFLFAIIFYLTKQIHIYAMLMLFAFCHEMGHLICGILLGLKPKSLKIMPMGLSIEFQISKQEYYKKIIGGSKVQIKQIWIALAGPITNVIIMTIAMIIRKYIEPVLYHEIVYANMLIAIFNLLPIYPLDGARILKATLHLIKGSKKAYEWICYISNSSMVMITMVASIAIYYYKNIAILFVITYLWSVVVIENRRYRLRKRIDKILENS